MPYKFKGGHDTAEATKTFVLQKVKMQLTTVTRRFKKFCLGCKNCDDQARSDKPKTGFQDLLQAIETNLVSSTECIR